MAFSGAGHDRSTAIVAANDSESATLSSQEIRPWMNTWVSQAGPAPSVDIHESQPGQTTQRAAVPARTVKVQQSPRHRRTKSRPPWRVELKHLLNKGHIFVGYAQWVTDRLNSRNKAMPQPFDAEILLTLEDVAKLTSSIRKASIELEKAVSAVVSPPSSCNCSGETIATTVRRQPTP